jgi:hypothetical protein
MEIASPPPPIRVLRPDDPGILGATGDMLFDSAHGGVRPQTGSDSLDSAGVDSRTARSTATHQQRRYSPVPLSLTFAAALTAISRF